MTEPAILLRPIGAAALLGVSERTAWSLVKTGELKSVKIGKRRLIPRSAVDAIVGVRIEEASDARDAA